MPRTILVVDDTRVSREPLAKLLRREGYKAVCASDGLEALSTMKANPPDLVLLDLMMPNMDGLSFLRAMRKDAWWKSLPVIVFTAASSPNYVAEAKALGVLDVIFKPSVDGLVSSIREHLPAGEPV